MNNPLPWTEGDSGRVNSPQTRNRLEFLRYVSIDPMEWLNRVTRYFEYYEVSEQEKMAMTAYYMEGKAHQL